MQQETRRFVTTDHIEASPAKAGVHLSVARAGNRWVPAFAGKASGGGFIQGGSAAEQLAIRRGCASSFDRASRRPALTSARNWGQGIP